MSYILEALKRANAERDRQSGAAPGLQAQALPIAPPARAAHGPLRSAMALAFVVVIVAGLLWWRQVEPQQPAAPMATAASRAAPASPAPASADVVATPIPALAQNLSQKARPIANAALPATPVRAPAAAPTSPSAAAATKAVTEPRILALSELPEALRAGLPKLQVNGSVYSSVASERLLILNGQPLREGEEAAPGLVLELIRAKSAVLKVQNTRFSLDF